MSAAPAQIRLGLVGYGEVGSCLGAGLRGNGLASVASYDIAAFDGPYSGLIQSRAAAAGVTLVRSAAELAEVADVILGVTPGSSSLDSAAALAPHLTKRHVFADVASATPKVKHGVADRLAATGALLADASIMGTPRDGVSLPILSSGPAAEAVRDALVPWGMNITSVGPVLGTASGIKILRSVLMKGIEALVGEMLLGARHYGIDEQVLQSASKTLSSRPFVETAGNLVATGVIHAKRRSEEVEMSCEALEDAGVDPIMTRATVQRLRLIESLGLKEKLGGKVPAGYAEAMALIEAGLAKR